MMKTMKTMMRMGIAIFILLAYAGNAYAGQQRTLLQTIGGRLDFVRDEHGGRLLLNGRALVLDENGSGRDWEKLVAQYFPRFNNEEDLVVIENRSGGSIGSTYNLIGINEAGVHWSSPEFVYTDLSFDMYNPVADGSILALQYVDWEGSVLESWVYKQKTFRHFDGPAPGDFSLPFDQTSIQQFYGRTPADLFNTMPDLVRRVKALLGDRYPLLCANMRLQSIVQIKDDCVILTGVRPHVAPTEKALIGISRSDLSIHGVIVSSELDPVGYWAFSDKPQAVPPTISAAITELVGETPRIASQAPFPGYHTFNKNRPESVTEALGYILRDIRNIPLERRDNEFLAFRRFFYEAIEAQNHQVGDYVSQYEQGPQPTSTQSISFKNRLERNGMTLLFSEGSPYCAEMPDFLLRNFKPYLSESMTQYYTQRSLELNEGFSEDAGLVITFAQLAKRVAFWEDYLERYPASAMAGEAQEYYNLYLRTLLTGMDNSRVFNMSTNVIEPEVKQVYAAYRSRYPNLRSGRLIGKFYDLLANTGFKYSPAVEQFYREQGVHSMLGVQPPTR